jgi:putative ABC transport system permease protein
MLLHYIKLSFRLMARSPFFTFVNILGLAIGFASFFALWNYAMSELSSDQFHKDFERIGRICWNWQWTDDGGQTWNHQIVGFTKSDIPVRAKEDLTDVEDFCRIHPQAFFGVGLAPPSRKITISAAGLEDTDKKFKEERIVYADRNLFSFFSIPLIYGKADDVLAEGGSIVLSQHEATKYFGDNNPVGQLMMLNDSMTLRVTGVFEDLPHNTHLTFDMVISNTPYTAIWATAFNAPTLNYIKLKEGVSFADFENKLHTREQFYFSALLQTIHNTKVDLFVQPLDEINLSPALPGDTFSSRSRSLLISFGLVSVVLLLMAWINYINLWVARNKKREKELATRKINGAGIKDFMLQFLIESALINLFAFFLAVTLLQFARNPFQYLFGIEIIELWQLGSTSLLILSLVFVGSIAITGLYPAFKARNNRPLSLFKKTPQASGVLFSSGLVIIQYTSAIALILWSSIVYFELNHILQHDLGLDRKNVLVVDLPMDKNQEGKIESLIAKLSSQTSIEKLAYGMSSPGEQRYLSGLNTRRVGSLTQVGFEWYGVNENYLPLFDLKLMGGRNFTANDRGDVAIVTEVAAQRSGFENPIDVVGTRLELLTNESMNTWRNVEIVGVIKDFRTVPFFETSKATDLQNEYQSRGKIFTYKNRGFTELPHEKLIVKAKQGKLDNGISTLEKEFKAVFPAAPFSWFFLEDNINNAYLNEKITRNQIALFVALATLIACLGFQGMIAHKVTSQTREIGIRKVLGASMSHITTIILQPSTIHFGISIAVGVPIAWYLGQAYLSKFSERIELQLWHYALPIILLFTIMMSTVATVIQRAARNNPVDTLKHD